MTNTNSQLLSYIEINPKQSPVGSVIWLHGLGANGNDFAPIVPELELDDKPLRFIFPHAPSRPVTVNNGYIMPAWFDIVSFDFNQRADEATADEAIQQINQLIEQEEARGIPSEKITLAGFSQGAVVALLVGLRSQKKLAGVLALSGFLPHPDAVKPATQSINQEMPFFIGHGTQDTIVPSMLGKMAYEILHKLGYFTSWHSYEMPHSVCGEEIQDIAGWLREIY